MSSSSSSSELSESTTEACLYTLDPATKKRKRWLDGFLVRYSTTEDSHRELVALFDSSFKNKICSETSVARYNVARSSQGKMFGMGVDHIPVQLIQHVENNLPDGKKKKQKIKFRGPTLHSPFVDTIREVERLINKKTNPIVTGLPRLAVLSTARRTPEVADSGGFINYWEAAVNCVLLSVL